MNSNRPKKLIRITTVPMSLMYLLPGQMDFMKKQGYDVLMISADGKERRKVMETENCPHTIVPMTRKITPLQDLKCLFQLIKIFRKEKPDIVHTHTPKAGLLGMIAAKICRVKIRIHTVAGLPMMVEKGNKYKVLKFVEKLTYSAANHVWPNSNSLKEFITSKKLTRPEKLSIIAKGSTNGINTDKFNENNILPQKLQEIKTAINYNAAHTYLLCMGRLVKDKGIVELINVFKNISGLNPNLKLLLVGDFEASLDPLPEATIQEIKTNASVIHISWTTDVEYYMHLADNFVFPSHREGFPNVLLQAGAMKLPIICSRIPGNIDIVENNETALIFDAGNESQIQSLILQALNQKEKMLVMAAKLKQIICTEYPRTYIWQQLLQRYSFIENSYRPSSFSLQGINARLHNLKNQLSFPLSNTLYNFPDESMIKKSA